MIKLNHNNVYELAKKLSIRIKFDTNHTDTHEGEENLKMYCVPRGGIPVGYLLMSLIKDSVVVDTPSMADIIIDDLIDSGKTQIRYREEYQNKPFYALIDKKVDEDYKDWISFVWEESDEETPVMDNLTRVKQFIESSTEEEKKPVIDYMMKILNK